jgi:two-component system, LytTR family, response regulator
MKPLLVRMSMKSIKKELPSSQFIRIHKSYIVSIDSIASVRKNSVFIGQFELPVGETYQGVIEQLTKRKS